LFLAWIFVSNYASSGAATAWNSLLFMALLFLCVLLHEFGHIFTAQAFGVPTPYVTLLLMYGCRSCRVQAIIVALLSESRRCNERRQDHATQDLHNGSPC